MRSEGSVAGREAGVPSEPEADTVKPVIPVESVSCLEHLDRGADGAKIDSAARASAESMRAWMVMAKTEAKQVSVAGKIDPRPVQPLAVATEADPRDEYPRGSREVVNPYTWLVRAKIVKIGRGEGESTQGSMSSAGLEPIQGSAFDSGRGACAHQRQWFRRVGRAHPSRRSGSARRKCAARRSEGG